MSLFSWFSAPARHDAAIARLWQMRTWLAQEIASDVRGAGIPHALIGTAEAAIERVISLLAHPAPGVRLSSGLVDTASDAAAMAAMGGDWASAVGHLERISPSPLRPAGRGTGSGSPAKPKEGAEPLRWDADHVWRTLAGDARDSLDRVSIGLGLSRHAAADRVDILVQQQRRGFRAGWLVRHWLDGALLLGVGAVLALGALDVQRARTRPPEHVLRATRALPAYHALAPGDVQATGPDSARRLALLRTAEHRYLLHPVPAGAVLADSVLGPARTGSLAGRSALALTLRPAAAAQQLSPGDHATLLISPSTPIGSDARGLVVHDVPVLDRAAQGDSIATLIIAVPDSLLAELAARLGTGSVHVLPFTAP